MAPGTVARRGEFPRRRGGDGSKGTDEQECYFESHQRPHLGSCVESVVSRLVALVVRFSKTEGIGVAGSGTLRLIDTGAYPFALAEATD